MLPPLKKPFDTSVLLKILHDLKLGHPQSLAARVDLDEALRNGWIEFWYQPKIDLRKKQLIGTEAFARARHPQHGILMPNAFMPGATEFEPDHAVRAGPRESAEGQHKLRQPWRHAAAGGQYSGRSDWSRSPFEDIVQTYRDQFEKWPGLIIDIAEDQIITELPLATEIAKKLRHLNVHLAIDHFGRAYSALTKLKESPFAELKLDRTFVADCASPIR